jgi:hypothetical protein
MSHPDSEIPAPEPRRSPIVTPGFTTPGPSDLGPVIHTVSLLHFDPHRLGRLPNTHVAAFYHNLAEALEVLQYLDTEAGYYSHLLIETYQPGYMPVCTEERWFQWDQENSGWLTIAKPEDMQQVINFALS